VFSVQFIKKNRMKTRVIFWVFLISILFSCKEEAPKVLIFIRNGGNLEYMLPNEVGMMNDILKVAGFSVKIATISGEVLKAPSSSLTPDLKLSEVNIDDYEGFMLPCMAAGDSITPEAVAFVKEIVKKNKPIAAQTNSVLTLAKAGVLNGKKYAYVEEKDWNSTMFPEFNNGIFSGTGVVQDGNILTSGICPWMARRANHQDGTARLTLTLINLINEKEK
jgi:putative intracellular protease/amidase